MKFVCVECDEPMKFESSDGLDDDGSLPVTFRCPSCEWGVRMLTNPQETQMVRTLGIKVGGSTVPPAPMEMMRSFLKKGASPHGPAASGKDEGSGDISKCPFSSLVKDLSD